MIVSITKDAQRILNKRSGLGKSIFNALNDIEIILDGSFFQGKVLLESDENKIWMNVCPTRYYKSSNEIEDICDQISYLIKCNHELDLPFKYNGETFRYLN